VSIVSSPQKQTPKSSYTQYFNDMQSFLKKVVSGWAYRNKL